MSPGAGQIDPGEQHQEAEETDQEHAPLGEFKNFVGKSTW
jgi:hypothetical protein